MSDSLFTQEGATQSPQENSSVDALATKLLGIKNEKGEPVNYFTSSLASNLLTAL